MEKLTPRQQQIVKLLAQGSNQKEIAYRLGIRHGTVRQHTMRIRERSACQSTAEVVGKVQAQK